MDGLLALIPEKSYPDLERYLLGLLSELRRQREKARMTEVCSKRATEWSALKLAARRAAQLPDEEAISIIRACSPWVEREQAVAHLQLARKRLKRELRDQRNRKIAALTRDGLSNSDIAQRVVVSVSTAAKKAARVVRGEQP